MYLLLLEEPCVAYYHSRYREVPLVLVAVLEVSVCSTQWDKGLYETTPSTMQCRFLVPGNTTKKIDTSFDTKMIVKSGAIEIIFKSHKPIQSYLLNG